MWPDVLVLVALLPVCFGQIKILSPLKLADQFRRGPLATGDVAGLLQGSTATFGSPSYGEAFIGRLLALNSTSRFCDDDYRAEAKVLISNSSANIDGIRNVFLIPRGNCTFVKKVEIAESCGADAVIVYDSPESTWDRKQVARVIMADDGHGVHVNIPSVLVTKEDGAVFLQTASEMQSKGQQVLIEMVWNLPQHSEVRVDFWMTSGRSDSFRFLSEFAPYAELLGKRLEFTPHFYIFDLPDNEENKNLCWNKDNRFCSSAPPSVSLTGADTVAEDLRQLCVLDQIQTTGMSSQDKVRDSLWWEYVRRFGTTCPFEGTSATNTFGEACSLNLLTSLGGKNVVEGVTSCVSNNTKASELLMREKDNKSWGALALRVNGVRFSGNLQSSLVLKAICAAFQQEPPECTDALRDAVERRSKDHLDQSSGFSAGELFLTFLFVMTVLAAALYVYQRHMQRTLRSTLRHEVMMEVKSQMQDYQNLGDGESELANFSRMP